MGTEQNADYYDQALGRVMLPYEESPWKGVYDAVVSLLPDDKAVKILDIGCGTGRCAEAIRRAGYRDYTGLDFSEVRIAEARRYVPGYCFLVADMLAPESRRLVASAGVFLFTEVLEHVEKDREILGAIPQGRLVIFSVPNFDSKGHVRVYESEDAIQARYEDLLHIERDRILVLPKLTRPHKKTFICRAVRT